MSHQMSVQRIVVRLLLALVVIGTLWGCGSQASSVVAETKTVLPVVQASQDSTAGAPSPLNTQLSAPLAQPSGTVKWEYKIVAFKLDDFGDASKIEEILTPLGQDGWELIQLTLPYSVFKRPQR